MAGERAPCYPLRHGLGGPRPGGRRGVARRRGRTAEIAALESFLARLGSAPAAIVFEGEAGFGKTTVWRRLLSNPAVRAFTVLSCRQVEAEAKLAFASLADLLEPVPDEVIARLPSPQRVPLDVALMRGDPDGVLPNARAVGTAVRSVLCLLAATAPVVLAIDDEQWLDQSSAEALGFALRRVGDHRVGVATTRRTDGTRRDHLGLERAFPERVERVRLGPLDLKALHHVLREHLGHVFPPSMLRRIGDAAGGNPFFALEIARALLDAGVELGPGEPLPVPDSIPSLIAQRLGRLPARTRDALLLVSASATPTRALLQDAAHDAALARAEQARVVDVVDGSIRFTHPLLASIVYASATTDERRRVHRRLATLVAAPEERARHLALSVSQPDARVAHALDDAATLARRRGAPHTAGELQERAAQLTPDDDPVARRRGESRRRSTSRRPATGHARVRFSNR